MCKPRRMTATALFSLSTVDMAAMGRLAAGLARAIRPGDVVLLVGDLGAGKTTFTKHVAAALGVTIEVTSPTFTIAHTYETADDAPVRSLMHLDAYRLRGADDLDAVGVFDGLEDGAAAIIEWGDIVADAFDDALTIEFTVVDDTTRSVTGSAPAGSDWVDRVASWVSGLGAPRC